MATPTKPRSSRVELNARHILSLSHEALRESVISHLRDELLAPERSASLSLVITDWEGTMPEAVRRILGELIRAQAKLGDGDDSGGVPGLRIAALDLHGKLGWFAALLKEHAPPSRQAQVRCRAWSSRWWTRTRG